MKRLTIKDIAKQLNVSISTVSKALNDSYEISVKTKEKIQKYACHVPSCGGPSDWLFNLS